MEFRLLGPVEVLLDDRPLALGGRRQRAVLTHLLLQRGTPVPTERLIALVWAETAPAAVRASLHTYVSRLRATLGPSRLETRSSGYVLHADPHEVDALALELALGAARAAAAADPDEAVRLYTAALEPWRGPALGDLAADPALAPVAGRLDALRDRAAEERVRARLACGQHVEVLPELTALLDADGLREDLWALYVLALYRGGRQADALAACTRARGVLRDELGLEPGQELRSLQERVLRHDPALTLPGSALHGYRLLEVLGQGASAVVHRAVQPAVGRHVALKVLHRAVADDPQLVHRFDAQAQQAAGLEHPHVVPVYDWWRGPGGACLVLRLLSGGTLAGLLQRGPVDLPDALRLLDQVAAGLDACSRQGVVHRGLTAEDVLLDQHGHAHVPSFVASRDVTWRGTAVPAPAALSTSGSSQPDAADRPDVAAFASLVCEVVVPRVPAPAAATVEALCAGAVVGRGPPGALALAAAVKDAVAPVPSQRRPRWDENELRNPYKGLRAFTEADASDYFGRSALVEALARRLAAPPDGEGVRFLAVVGPSGSGKSSLVRAGLVPALRAGGVPDVDRWYVVDVVPDDSPFAALETALRRVAVVPLAADAAASFRHDRSALLSAAHSVLPVDDDGRSGVLVLVDQFEELFTLVGDDERRAFVDALVTAVTTPSTRVRAVVTLRADFYDRPLSHLGLAQLVQAGTEVVVPLSAEGLEQAVVEPAERAGLRVDPALLAQVVADVGDAPGALPLLQFALTELAERTEDGVLSLTGYREVGGVAGALVQRADGLHARSTPEEKRVARQVLLQLVQPTESGTDARRRVLQDELVRRTDDPDTARSVITAYGAARLLAFDRDPATRAPTVEVAHEALLTEWAVLRDWTDAARDDLRHHARLAAAAREWDESGRDPSFLVTGSRLQALEQWSSTRAGTSGWGPSPLERDYLDASLHARESSAQEERLRRDRERVRERRSVRRLRAVATALALAVVLASGLTVFGFSQQSRAERESVVAEARALAAASVASLDVDPERAVLLALEAVGRTQDEDGSVLPEAEEALHRAVVASRVLRTIVGIGGAVAWSDRGLLVTEGPEDAGTIDLRDAASGRRVRVFPAHDGDVDQVVFSPDGGRLLSTGDDGAARLWDPATGRLLWERVGQEQASGPSFSRDGRRVAAAWPDEGVVRVLDAATGAVLREVPSVPQPKATALSRDGSQVVLAGSPVPGALVHDVRTGAQLLHLGADGQTALGVAVSRDGQQVATSTVDSTARLWSLADGAPRGTLWSSAPVADLDWSPDGSRVVLGGDDGVARVFDVGRDGTREVLRLSSSRLRGITGAAFSPDGGRVLLGDGTRSVAQLWDVSVGGSREWATVAAPEFALVGADFAAGGRRVMASGSDGRVAYLDARDGSLLARTRRSGSTVGLLRTSPDGALLAGVADQAARVWDVRTRREVFAVPYEGQPLSLAWSPDGQVLAVTSEDGRLRLVDRRGDAVPGPTQEPGEHVVAAAFSPDGRVLVMAHRSPGGPGTGRVSVVERSSGQVRHRLPADSELVAVSPDSRQLATMQDDGDVVLWDLDTGVRVRRLIGHVGPVWDMAYSPDGRQLATSGQDATVRLWDLEAETRSLVLRGHDKVVLSVRFSPSGDRLVTASGDGTVRIWAVALDDLVRLASSRLTRALTDDECRRYLQRSCS